MTVLTKHQERALEAMAHTDSDAHVIGWDTSVQGPLVAFDHNDFYCVAISPRGKQIDRIREEQM